MSGTSKISEQSARFAYTLDFLKELASETLKKAKKSGASACEVDVSEALGLSVGVRRGEIETIEHNRDKGIGVTVYLGQQKGHASSSDFSRKALHEMVDAALNIARFTAADPSAGLPEASLLASTEQSYQDLDLYHPWQVGADTAAALAKACEQAAFAVDPMISNSEGASVSSQQSQFILANSLGFMGGYPTSRHHLDCSVIAGKGKKMQRDYWYSSARDSQLLSSPEAIGDYAARRALSRLNARKLKTCEVPVLFEAPVATSLISHFVQAVSGGSLYRGTSFLLNSLGTQVFSKKVNISERPHLQGAPASSMFDSEGVATQDREIVEKGKVQGYFLSTYTARKLGMQTTGNAGGTHNLIVHPGKYDLEGLIKKMGRGLLVTELLGQGINYVNGDYSRGAFGYWVENGQIQHPVEEITIAGNLRDMFRHIVEVGNDVLVRGTRSTGSILVERMKVAGS